MAVVSVNQPSIVSPPDQRVSFVELFFDLVFVFCITQLVQLLHDGYTAGAVVRAVTVFWLVWWAWTQFTWTLNAADTTHARIELATLAATATAFFMAVAIPGAFGDKSLWFAAFYVVVRLLGLTMQGWVAYATSAAQHAAARRFFIFATAGLAAVLVGGYLGGKLQYWFWTGAIALDAISALVGGRDANWNLHADHFAERHGLFVIITLGETLIVAAGGLSHHAWTGQLLVATLAVLCAGALWWVYFARAKPALDHTFEHTAGLEQAELARDAYSLLHFPILGGLIAFAATIEAAILHPGQPLSSSIRIGLAIGMILYLCGMAICLRRATARLPWSRVVIGFATAIAIVLVPGPSPVTTFAILLVGTVMIAVVEQGAAPPRSSVASH